MTFGPSIVFLRKVVVDALFIRDSSYICKSIVGIEASQLYPNSMSQDMPTGLYTRWEFDSDMQNSRLDITDLAFLRECSYLFNKKRDHNVEVRASAHLDIWKLTEN